MYKNYTLQMDITPFDSIPKATTFNLLSCPLIMIRNTYVVP